VEKGNYLKFSKSKDTSLKRKLLDTKDRELVEVSLRSLVFAEVYLMRSIYILLHSPPKSIESGELGTEKRTPRPTERIGVKT